MKIWNILIAVSLWLVILLATGILQACGSEQGWRVSFGVTPVTAISDTQTLTKSEKTEAKNKNVQ